MEIVNISAETFEKMLSKFEDFASRMEYLLRLHGDRDLKEWLDNQEVCQLLNISKRTLQTLRDNGTLAYTQISHKMYYKPEDVERIIPVVREKQKQANFKRKQI
ncbi:carbamoylphosphate synthase small subunit [Parabacteroides sp. PF5-5]|uniref:helix-turn-helix domain-containing protein n=1 Tax=unclassified Parabacteroides TaxID=2649774 RepID=UPI0024731861|nr:MULTISPECIES: helix-turn-helix domain-containing protein [unclassified Parabacteroides]MDH6306015.1 carbamoylphosphate synthase small subunit [Parabacteroides sp. PH5-39]MDH6317271.1 carbamoylphosphate synthase small subunit [Parabacteroides sp. PF5-13]MDH6320727.1 carbamoylphosphate synthase small subunit [Parabacteroides sp. PH5-13]MDH6324352.1 carbamoylphosphate synthase small subunit [Parabacteroides sp. PH5-8]MDH6328456.1 carbamoylphosphate synthase small subunit [Parabacteroides sp. P